ncbi:DNA repair protein RecO [Streptomyces avidinii]
MSLFRDDGIVLRTQKLGEADRIITLLTRGHGRVRAVARGVRRTKSKFGARLEPFSHADVQFFARGSELIGRGLPLCTQSETIAPYGGGIVSGLRPLHRGHRDAGDGRAVHRERGRAGRAAVPAARRRPCAPSRAASTRPHLILDAFLLRSLAVNGYAPELRGLREVRPPRPQPALLRRARAG